MNIGTCFIENATSNVSVEEGSIRLVGGLGPHKGRVEVYIMGHWGSVVNGNWDFLDATVVCRQLSYPKALPSSTSNLCQSSNGTLWTNNTRCTGYERNLMQCRNRHLQQYSQEMHNIATVTCLSKDYQ